MATTTVLPEVEYPPTVCPNDQALDIPNLVPGAEILGYGFNIFGPYSFDSAIRPLFDLGDKTTPYTYPESGATYQVPSNVSPPGGSSASASAHAFSTASEFVDYFQASASVSGSVGAFSASFSGTYSQQQQDASAYSWALVEGDYYAWHLQLFYSSEILRANILKDPDWKDLPHDFTRENAAQFYNFFQKFGTHFISSVGCGGTLYYYFSVEQDSNLNSTQISASASAEYQGLICSGKAQAEAYWSQCATNWTSSRQSFAQTVPATTGVIDWINPPSGSYDDTGAFAGWKDSVVNNPSRSDFGLTTIDRVFSGSQAIAIQQAYAAYASNLAHIEAYRDRTPTVLINGKPIVPEGGYPGGAVPGWQMVVLDGTLQTVLDKFYTVDTSQPNWPDPTFRQMSEDLRPYAGNREYLLVTATSFGDEGMNPTEEFYGLLKSFGAGDLLDSWMSYSHSCSFGEAVAYILVGRPGDTAGCEAFTTERTSTNEGVTVDAFFNPSAGSFTPTPYQP
jgi:hypothetical protein